MRAHGDPPPAPAVFCEALRRWVASSPTGTVTAPLEVASQVAQRMAGCSDFETFEQQLSRLASRETCDVAAETRTGARLVLDLWQAFGEPADL